MSGHRLRVTLLAVVVLASTGAAVTVQAAESDAATGPVTQREQCIDAQRVDDRCGRLVQQSTPTTDDGSPTPTEEESPPTETTDEGTPRRTETTGTGDGPTTTDQPPTPTTTDQPPTVTPNDRSPTTTTRTPTATPGPISRVSATATGANSFRVRVGVLPAGFGASVAAPATTGDPGTDGELRAVGVQAVRRLVRQQIGVSTFGSWRNASAAVSGAASTPSLFDTGLAYVVTTTDTDPGLFDLTYSLDVDRDRLRDLGASRTDVVVAAYRGGEWHELTNTTRYRSGSELVVNATVPAAVPVALGVRHANLTVRDVSPARRPLLSNRTNTLDVTVANVGSRDGSERFSVETSNDRILTNRTLSAPMGGTRTHGVPVRFNRSGEWPIEIGNFETTFQVREPRVNLTVTNLTTTPSRLQAGNRTVVRATVRNTGRGSGQTTVEFRAFGEVVTARRLSLGPGESARVEFTQRIDAPGTYRLGVENRTVPVTVVGRAGTAADRRTGTPTASTDWTETFGGLAWLALFVGLGVVLLGAVATANYLRAGD